MIICPVAGELPARAASDATIGHQTSNKLGDQRNAFRESAVALLSAGLGRIVDLLE